MAMGDNQKVHQAESSRADGVRLLRRTPRVHDVPEYTSNNILNWIYYVLVQSRNVRVQNVAQATQRTLDS